MFNLSVFLKNINKYLNKGNNMQNLLNLKDKMEQDIEVENFSRVIFVQFVQGFIAKSTLPGSADFAAAHHANCDHIRHYFFIFFSFSYSNCIIKILRISAAILHLRKVTLEIFY